MGSKLIRWDTEVAQETVGDAAEVLIVGDGRNYAALLNDFIAAHNIQKLGIEDDYMSLGQFNALTDSLKAELVIRWAPRRSIS